MCIVTLLKLYAEYIMWVFVAAHELVAESRGYPLAAVCGLLIAVASHVVEHRF